MENNNLTWSDFEKVEMRIGTILSADVFKEVKNPAYKLQIDFGEFGIKKTSAQITKLYTTESCLSVLSPVKVVIKTSCPTGTINLGFKSACTELLFFMHLFTIA